MEPLFAAMIAVLGFALAVALIVFWNRRRQEMRYVKMEMGRAETEREYQHWQRELTALRWCLIPGLSPAWVARHLKKREER